MSKESKEGKKDNGASPPAKSNESKEGKQKELEAGAAPPAPPDK